MATDSGSSYLGLIAKATHPLPDPTWLEPGDLSRQSVEALVGEREGDARGLASAGTLRLHGPGVEGHAAELDRVGAIAASWQRAVTAVGASLENVKTMRGRLSASQILSQIAGVDLEDTDAIGARLREFGPRVASSLRNLATVLVESDIELDAAWRDAPTRHASWNVHQARWAKDFIEGRDLDSDEEDVHGLAVTVSNRERWLLETPERAEKVAVADLSLEDVRRVRPGDMVALRVRTTTRVQPDGTSIVRRQAIRVVDVRPGPSETQDGMEPTTV